MQVNSRFSTKAAAAGFRTAALTMLALAASPVARGAAPDLAGDRELVRQVASRADEYRRLWTRWTRLHPLDTGRRTELEERMEALRGSAFPPGFLDGLAINRYLYEDMEKMARAAYVLRSPAAIPALRSAAGRLVDADLREVFHRALCSLGDRDYLASFYGDDWRRLADSFYATPPADRHQVLWEILAQCGDAELARRSDRGARVVADGTPFVPYSRIFYRGDQVLRGGEDVKILSEGVAGRDTEGQLLVFARDEIGWLDEGLLREGPPDAVEDLVGRVRRAWASGDHRSLPRPLQELRFLHGADLASLDLPMAAAVAEALAAVLPIESRGAGSGSSRRRVVALDVEEVAGEKAPEILLHVETGYWEGRGESIEILYRIGEGPIPERFVIETLADDLFETVFRRFPHRVNLDEDPDLELVVLEGTSSWAPQDNARSWKVRLYDFDGRRFAEIGWTAAMRAFLRRRLESAEDDLERTILRSHFGSGT